MTIVVLCAACAAAGCGIGLLMADEIAERKLRKIRLQMGLDMDTGAPIETDEDKLFNGE